MKCSATAATKYVLIYCLRPTAVVSHAARADSVLHGFQLRLDVLRGSVPPRHHDSDLPHGEDTPASSPLCRLGSVNFFSVPEFFLFFFLTTQCLHFLSHRTLYDIPSYFEDFLDLIIFV